MKGDPTSEIGVKAVSFKFLNDLKWYPREQRESDFGIDMQVEIAKDNIPSGSLVGVQIKSGPSYFKERTIDSIIFRGRNEHLEYWLAYSLPVIVVLYDTESNIAYWQNVTPSNVKRTSKSWKMYIPTANILNKSAIDSISQLTKETALLSNYHRMFFDKPLMNIAKNGRLRIEYHQWVNKSSGRATVYLIEVLGTTEEILVREDSFLTSNDYNDLGLMFPWARFQMDESVLELEDELAENWKYNNGRQFYDEVSLSRYLSRIPKVRPYSTGGGELYKYRFKVKVNSLAKSFLKFDVYMRYGKQLKLIMPY